MEGETTLPEPQVDLCSSYETVTGIKEGKNTKNAFLEERSDMLGQSAWDESLRLQHRIKSEGTHAG